MKYGESKLQLVLETLRGLADKRTERMLEGRLVAYIVPPPAAQRWSLIREVSGRTGMPHGTVGNYVGILVQTGLIEPGNGTQRVRRWVVMTGALPPR